MDNTFNNLFDKYSKQLVNIHDEAIKNLLISEGYTINNTIDLLEAKDDLERKGMFVNHIEFTEFDCHKCCAITHVYPFFDSIDSPVNRHELTKKFEEYIKQKRLKRG